MYIGSGLTNEAFLSKQRQRTCMMHVMFYKVHNMYLQVQTTCTLQWH